MRCRLRRVLREEKKFLLNYSEFYKVKGFLTQVMTPDSHNNNEGYMVRSLYFDTLDDLCFVEKMDGVGKRKKLDFVFMIRRLKLLFWKLSRKMDLIKKNVV